MRVLVFSTDDFLYPAGGAEQALGNIVKRLPDVEFDLICAKLRRGVKGYERVGNVSIYRMGFGIPKLDAYILALFGHWYAYKLMRKHHYHVLWSIMASYGAFSAVRVKKKTGLPFLLSLQEGDEFEYIYKKVHLVRHQFDEIFTIADGIQAISNYLLAWSKKMGFRGEIAEVVPNGVAVNTFSRVFPAEEIRETRASFGFPNNARILLTSSRLEEKNGIGDVISALSLLPDHFCFVVCGSGSLERELKNQVVGRGLNTRVKFMGFVDPLLLPRLMQSADIFIRPSLSEGLGNAFLEAMAARLLVIGTSVGGIPDFLEDGETGFFASPRNPQSIVDIISRIETLSSIERRAIVERARTLTMTTYSWDIISEQMRNIFNRLTEEDKNNG